MHCSSYRVQWIEVYNPGTGYPISTQSERYEGTMYSEEHSGEPHRLLSRDSEVLSMGYCQCWSDQTRRDATEVWRCDDTDDHVRAIAFTSWLAYDLSSHILMVEQQLSHRCRRITRSVSSCSVTALSSPFYM